jgi:hypothetical protein
VSGTVNIARSIFDHELFADQPLTEREAWIWLIMEASWKPRKKRVGDYIADLARGELAASVRFMAGAWKWTPAKVQRFMKRLQVLDMISVKTDTGVSVITICNYDEYQSQNKAADTDAIQERYRSDTNEKKGEIREEGSSEANASDASVDFAKQLWDRGVAFLERSGTPAKQGRAIIGKWRKAYQDTDIFDAFAACSKQGVVDPIPWISARLSGKDKGNGATTRSETRLRAFLAGAAVSPGMGAGEDCNASQPLLARR